jgi:hypothetical protein
MPRALTFVLPAHTRLGRSEGRVLSLRRVGASVLALAVAVAGITIPSDPVQAAPRPVTAAVTKDPAVAASKEAAASGEPVEVKASRDEYSQTFANPDGTFTLSESAAPQRARDASGAWTDVDPMLERRADGSLAAKAAAVKVSFAGKDGDGRGLIHLAQGDLSLTLDWPGHLPAPTLDGDTAKYANVFPDVDLLLTATAEGYREVLVVNTAAAAATTDLSKVQLAVHATGLQVVAAPGGGMQAVDGDGNTVFAGPAGMMWDSSGDATPLVITSGPRTHSSSGAAPVDSGSGNAESGDASGEGVADPADGPDAGDRTAELPVHLSGGSVSVIPDAGLLKTGKFPVFVDPPVGLSSVSRTVLTSNGGKYWAFDNDYDSTTGRDNGRGVGLCSSKVISGKTYTCSTSAFTSRMFFSFVNKRLLGKVVLDATFRLTETWSFSCNPMPVSLAKTAAGISSATKWPGPAATDWLTSTSVSHGRGSACSPSQPNAAVDFHDRSGQPNDDLTATVKNLATGKLSALTVLVAGSESEPEAWKRFENNATLSVTYYPSPGVPTSVGVQATNDPKSVTCRDVDHAITVADPTPPVLATVQTLVQPAADEAKGSLRAVLTVQAYDPVSKTGVTKWTTLAPSTGYVTDGSVQSAVTSTLPDGAMYRVAAQTRSYVSFGGTLYGLTSGPSVWCYFTVNSQAPKPPVVTPAAAGPYTACTATVCNPGGGPGVPGTFTLSPNSDSDISGYRWTLTGGVSHTVTGSTVTLDKQVVPPYSGTLVLTVEAMDLPNRYGPPATFTFKVAAPDGPVGRWQFTEGTGTTAADTATAGIGHPLSVNAGGLFDARGRRGAAPDDYALRLDGTSGYAATANPVVNTAGSFTVAGWVYLNDTGRAQSFLSQGDGAGTGFNLGYRPATGWVFDWHHAPPGQSASSVQAVATMSTPAKVWTHVAGVYDATGKTVQLLVNGRSQATPVPVPAALTPVLTSGGLQLGRGGDTSTVGEYASGLFDEVEVWGRALPPEELRLDAQLVPDSGLPATALAGAWSGDTGDGVTIPDSSGYGRGSMTLAGGASSNDDGMVVLDGTAGYASTTGPVVDETASFTVTAQVKLNSAALAQSPAGYVAEIAGQQAGGEGSWGLWYQLESVVAGVPQGRWYFGRTALDGSSHVIGSAAAHSVDVVDLDDDPVVQLTGVYDAFDDTLHLYVGQQEQAPDDTPPAFPYAQAGSGDLTIGRGRAGGVWGRYLPGQIGELRVWAGAMTREQIATQILGICLTGCTDQ